MRYIEKGGKIGRKVGSVKTTAQMKADHPKNIGGYGPSEKSGGQLRFAWKAIHIACDVGNRGQA